MVGLLSLADPSEIARVGLTPEKLQAMLADAAGTPAGIALTELHCVPLREPQNGYNRWGSVEVRAGNGSQLVDMDGHPLGVVIQAYNTDAGWKISVTKFLYAVLVGRTGMALRKQHYAALCEKFGVAPELYWPENGRWEWVLADR